MPSSNFIEQDSDNQSPTKAQIRKWKRFLTKSKKLYGNDFEYLGFKIGSFEDLALIHCKKHNQDFVKGLSGHLKPSHLLSHGCSICDKEKWHAEFIVKAKAVHGSIYVYDKVDYVGSRTPITITCKDHGDFTRTPESHYKGSGCPRCTGVYGGWTRSNFKALCDETNEGKAFLYVIQCHNNNESFYKIGITSKRIKERFRKDMPYNYKEVFIIESEASYIHNLETNLHELLKDYQYAPNLRFGGHTECFTEITVPVLKLLKNLTANKQVD